MKPATDIRRGRHCVFNLHAHLVFVTKYRRFVFTKALLSELQEIFSDVCEDFEAELLEFNGEDDHVHLLVTYPPKVAISHLVNSLKGVSSRLLRKQHGAATPKSSGETVYGLQATSLEAAEALPSASFASILSSNAHHTN